MELTIIETSAYQDLKKHVHPIVVGRQRLPFLLHAVSADGDFHAGGALV